MEEKNITRRRIYPYFQSGLTPTRGSDGLRVMDRRTKD